MRITTMFYVYRNTTEREQAIAKFNKEDEALTYMERAYNGIQIPNVTGYSVRDSALNIICELEV